MSYLAAVERYTTMSYRRCGRSGVKLPAVSLGLWQNFGGDHPLEASRKIICRAFDLGITHFDLRQASHSGQQLRTVARLIVPRRS